LHIRLATDKKLKRPTPSGPLALILTPTKELAEQVQQHTKIFAKYLPDISVLGLYGGVPQEKQVT